MRDADVAVIIVNWNGWRHTLACVEALRRTEGVSWHAYVVDNASSDESVARLSGLDGDAELVASDVNRGWSGGNNFGLARALTRDHRYVFLLNNDATVRVDTIRRLVDAHDGIDGPSPVLGALQRTDDGSEFSFVAARRDPRLCIPIWLPWEEFPKLMQQPLIASAFAGGAALFAHRALYDEIGLFDERFFLNYDETDWCFRAAAAGHPIYTVRDAVVHHTGNATIGGQESPLQNYFLTRNQLLFAEKHGTRAQLAGNVRKCLGLMKWLSTSDSLAGRARKLLRPEPRMKAVQYGIRDYLLRRFGDCPDEVRRLNRLARASAQDLAKAAA